METERQLIEAMRRGERAAQRWFYDRFASRAMAVAMRYMGNSEDARDVVQDAFVRMLTSVSRFNYHSDSSLQSWVMRIVSNMALDHLKKRRLLGRQVELTDMACDPDDTAPPDTALIAPEVLTRLIGQLPPGYRTVLNLYVFEGYTHSEISQLLNIKEKTSASQLSRAKQLLAQIIEEYSRTHRT